MVLLQHALLLQTAAPSRRDTTSTGRYIKMTVLSILLARIGLEGRTGSSTIIPSGYRSESRSGSTVFAVQSSASNRQDIRVISITDYFDHEACRLEPIESSFGLKMLVPRLWQKASRRKASAPQRRCCE